MMPLIPCPPTKPLLCKLCPCQLNKLSLHPMAPPTTKTPCPYTKLQLHKLGPCQLNKLSLPPNLQKSKIWSAPTMKQP